MSRNDTTGKGDDRLEDKMNEKRQDYFGSKYSEHVFGSKEGSITSPERNEAEKERDNFEEKGFWSEVDQEDYTKKQTYSKDIN